MKTNTLSVALIQERNHGDAAANLAASGVLAVLEAARRALLNPQCNPLPLPKDRLEALRNTVFRFNPRDLGLR